MKVHGIYLTIIFVLCFWGMSRIVIGALPSYQIKVVEGEAEGVNDELVIVKRSLFGLSEATYPLQYRLGQLSYLSAGAWRDVEGFAGADEIIYGYDSGEPRDSGWD